MEAIINKSIGWLQDNKDVEPEIRDWIKHGDRINYHVITNTPVPKRSKGIHEGILAGMECILEESNIQTKEDLVLWRETSFPNQDVPVFTSVSSRSKEDFCGAFGDKVYPIQIPKGTRMLYISAFDRLQGRSDEESEQEFLLKRGITKLVGGVLIFTPLD